MSTGTALSEKGSALLCVADEVWKSQDEISEKESGVVGWMLSQCKEGRAVGCTPPHS